MKNKYITYIAVICVSAMSLLLYGCKNEQVAFKKAEQSFALGEYYEASLNYKKSYSRVPSKDKAKRAVRAYKMGDCYRRINYTEKAIAAFQNAIRYKTEDSTAYFYLAQMQLRKGDYKNAKENFELYLEKDPGNVLAKNGIESCLIAPEWKANPNLYKIKKEDNFNSRRSDFSPVLVGEAADQILISTTRTDVTGEDINGITGTKYGDIFFATKDEKQKLIPNTMRALLASLLTERQCISPDAAMIPIIHAMPR